MRLLRYFAFALLPFLSIRGGIYAQPMAKPAAFQDLVQLFRDWRAFEIPPLRNGAPDYSQRAFAERWPVFKTLEARLLTMDTSGWTIPQRADWQLVRAEMNGYSFNQQVLMPWIRDPAFYKSVWTERSDVPAHEGPTHHYLTELWTYQFPLRPEAKNKLLADLAIIPPLCAQARQNLTGNARELWIAGIRDIKGQTGDLKDLLQQPGVAADAALNRAIQQAISATNELAAWLEQEAPRKTGPSGIGKEQYTWYIQNVHLVPMTWDDEVMLLKRELSRAWAALKLEEHRNRNLPPLPDADSPEAYQKLADASARSLLRFLQEEEIVTVKDYFEPALREHLGTYIPREKRHFFWIGAHYDPRPLYSHFYHWFELARMDRELHPDEIRRTAPLYNIFDSRNEGLATAVEELFMHAGLYDDSPRSREIVYILIAQRAARGLGSLYAHANLLSMEEAGAIHSEFTPRGWMKTEKDLRIFEQHLYLRQPGYGTSYISGKYLLENALAEYSRQLEAKGQAFSLRQFMDFLNQAGHIPASLAYWELNGSTPKDFPVPLPTGSKE